jgi:hypothetical protein
MASFDPNSQLVRPSDFKDTAWYLPFSKHCTRRHAQMRHIGSDDDYLLYPLEIQLSFRTSRQHNCSATHNSLNLPIWTPRPSPRPPLRRCPSPSATLAWRRSHKRKVHLDSLIQQLRTMHTINRRARLIQRRILDKRISLICQSPISLIFI